VYVISNDDSAMLTMAREVSREMAIRVAGVMTIGLGLVSISAMLGIWSLPQCWGLAEWSQVVACLVVGALGCAGLSVTNRWRGDVASEKFRRYWFVACLLLTAIMFHNAWSWATGGWFWLATGQPVVCG
jgi:hypothetical protein